MRTIGAACYVASYLLAVADVVTQDTKLVPSGGLPMVDRIRWHVRRHLLLVTGGLCGVAGTILQALA